MFEKIVTKEQVEALDSDLLVCGYRAGLRSQPDYTQREQAYWHGYLNGQVDAGKSPPSVEQMELASDWVNKLILN